MLRREPCYILLLTIELALVITAICVFAHGRSSNLRTALWQTGGDQGWNSNPRLRIYFYANHREPPDIPFLWREDFADSLLGIAIFNASVWLVRVVVFQTSIGPPWTGVIYDVMLSGLWTYGVNTQLSSDLTDTQHLSVRPWYLERGCGELSPEVGAVCGLGRAQFSVTVVCMVFYFLRAVGSVLRLAYWCGEYGLVDRCVEKIGEIIRGSDRTSAQETRITWTAGGEADSNDGDLYSPLMTEGVPLPKRSRPRGWD